MPDEKRELTPAAKALKERISAIMASAKSKPKGSGFIDADMQTALRGMTAADMLELEPPSTDAGIWTNDPGFCVRLGSRLFGCSPESVHELPWQHYLFFTQIVTANFIRSMEGVIPS